MPLSDRLGGLGLPAVPTQARRRPARLPTGVTVTVAASGCQGAELRLEAGPGPPRPRALFHDDGATAMAAPPGPRAAEGRVRAQGYVRLGTRASENFTVTTLGTKPESLAEPPDEGREERYTQSNLSVVTRSAI